MLKKGLIRKLNIIFFSILIILVIHSFPKTNEVANIETYKGNIYLLDKNSYVSEVDFVYKSNNTIDLAYEVIDILTIGSDYPIRDGFKKIIPKNTKVKNIYIENKTITVDFTDDFINISPSLEEKEIEALVYSLTSIDGVDNVIIKIEGKRLKELFYSKEKLPKILNRKININKEYSVNSLENIFYTTIFYVGIEDGYKYLIPVTKYSNNKKDHVEVIISELKSHTTYNTNIIDFTNELNVSSYNILENMIIVNLSSIDGNLEETLKYAINKSINENYSVPCIYYLNNHLFLE